MGDADLPVEKLQKATPSAVRSWGVLTLGLLLHWAGIYFDMLEEKAFKAAEMT